MFNISSLGFVTVIILNVFSNIVDHSRQEFALVSDDGTLIVQKDPSTYWGYYEAYYFSRQMENSYCVDGIRDTFGKIIKDHVNCVRYTLLPEKIKKGGGVRLFGNFKKSNSEGTYNTRKVVEQYSQLVAEGIIPSYPDFIQVRKGR
jgi:hypothetical protein